MHDHELYAHDHQRDTPVLSGIGGQFMQMYFVVAAIHEQQGKEISAYYERIQKDPKSHAPQTPIELCLEANFTPFLLNYLNDLKG